ncbi:MAG: hypothetical protein QG657_2730 [Acidobacteriota bacterium]|nr:hypothetical protein [Acidobacteriota bacterium]
MTINGDCLNNMKVAGSAVSLFGGDAAWVFSAIK